MTEVTSLTAVSWPDRQGQHVNPVVGSTVVERVLREIVLGSAVPPPELCNYRTIEQACRAGLRSVKIMSPIALSATASDTEKVGWLRLLRDLTACSVSIEWTLVGDIVMPVEQLVHIAPPSENSTSAVAQVWRRNYKFGALYWRRGPGFYMIRDSRVSGIQLFALDDAESRTEFERCTDGASGASSLSVALEEMIINGLVVRFGDWLLALPYRMRHWPVPFRAI